MMTPRHTNTSSPSKIPLIKLCGFTTYEGLTAAIKAGADMVGFVFYPASVRHISIEKAAQLIPTIPNSISSVAVTVDADDALLDALFNASPVNAIQLHGSETPERAAMLKKRYGVTIIKALAIHTSKDVAQADDFEEAADMLLCDAKAMAPHLLPGGNGLSFDWSLLNGYEGSLPMLVSGGLTIDNVAKALDVSGAQGVDVSSGIESSPGVKDPLLIHDFVLAARKALTT